MDNILRAALLVRVSTDEQAKTGDSLEAQQETLVAFANNNNMKIVGIYRDEGYSARKPVLKRPAMLKLIEDVKAGKVDIIIFTKLDRFFRNVKEYYKIQEILERNRVTWKAVKEDYTTATSDGRLKINIWLSIAENEADRTSDRIKDVFNSKIMRKEVIMPPQCVPMGYKIVEIDGAKKFVKDDETREITEYFFNLAITTSIRQAAIQTEHKYGLKRDSKAWYTMCHNELYTGRYKGVEDYCEPYLTPSQFCEVSKNKGVRKAKNNRAYLFTGLITCPLCGWKMISKFAISGNGREYYYYRCPHTTTKQCSVKNVSEKLVESYVLENIKAELEKFILAHEVSEPQPKKKKSDATKFKEQLRRVNVSYQLGNMEDAEYIAETKKLKAMIEQATKEENQENHLDITALKEFLESGFEEIYDALEKDEKQRLWRSVIDELIYDGQNIVGIKFKV